jgi:hypothetical protein
VQIFVSWHIIIVGIVVDTKVIWRRSNNNVYRLLFRFFIPFKHSLRYNVIDESIFSFKNSIRYILEKGYWDMVAMHILYPSDLKLYAC